MSAMIIVKYDVFLAQIRVFKVSGSICRILYLGGK
jgi:hypothetical protein